LRDGYYQLLSLTLRPKILIVDELTLDKDDIEIKIFIEKLKKAVA